MFNTSVFNEGRHSDSCTCELKFQQKKNTSNKNEDGERKRERSIKTQIAWCVSDSLIA